MFESDETGILIVGHGSREENANGEFKSFVDEYRRARPAQEIRPAYIELAKPDVKSALTEFSGFKKKIVVLPLFLFTSGHIKNDIPLILHEMKARFPDHRYFLIETLGMHPDLVRILFDRAQEAEPLSAEEKKRTGVIVAGRGSSDVDANGEFYKTVRFFEEGGGYAFVFPAFIGIASPLLPEALERAARLRPERLLVLPYFLFGGRLMRRIQKTAEAFAADYPWIKTKLARYFGPDPGVLAALDDKIEEGLAGRGLLPCVTCEYRRQMPGLADKVGGLRALLWSLRHMETHNQAAPHEFPHKTLRKHVLVCENVDCAGKGSLGLIGALRRIIKDSGKQADFRVTRTSCMGRCGEGPTVVVYPDGIWYRNVQASDAEDLVHQHLMNDRIVSRLVDNIMQ